MSQVNPLLFTGHVPESDFVQMAAQSNGIGALCFASDMTTTQTMKAQSAIPCLHVAMENLTDNEAVVELWSGVGTLKQGSFGEIDYQYDEDILFGVIHLSELDFVARGDQTRLQQATETAYRQIFALIQQRKFPHIFRFWNYIPEINQETDHLERYRQFNLGRYDAFVADKRDVVGNVPVACALGFSASEHATLSIAFIAGKAQPIPIENPRQISAYQYPKQYGPVSPTFSRASLVKLKQSELLLISGTASIVGHATHHISDAVIQAREAMTNIDAILNKANAMASEPFALVDLDYRIYVRQPEQQADIHQEILRYIGAEPSITYLRADICRQDLLLEIEASAENFAAKSKEQQA